jgi:hypothetical protein
MPSVFRMKEQHRCDPGCFVARLVSNDAELRGATSMTDEECLPITHVFAAPNVHYLVLYRTTHNRRLRLYDRVMGHCEWLSDLKRSSPGVQLDPCYLYSRQRWDHSNTSTATIKCLEHEEQFTPIVIVANDCTGIDPTQLINPCEMESDIRKRLKYNRHHTGSLWVTKADVLAIQPSFCFLPSHTFKDALM